MKYLILILLLVFPFGQLARWAPFGNEVVLHLNDLAVLVVLIFGLRRISGPLVRPLILFATAVFLSLAVNFLNFKPLDLVVASLYPLRFFAYAGLFFVLRTLSPAEKTFTKRWLLISVVIIALFGFLQYIFIPNVSFLSALDWDDHYYRLVGSFLDPGFTGAILGLGLIFVFLERGLASKKLQILRLGFIFTALALTYSRASYLLYLASFTFIAFSKKSLKIFFVAALILGLTILILPKSTGEGTKLERENSVISRIRNWQESIQIWSKAPVFGVGFNTYRYVRNSGSQSHAGAGADSSILLILATTGLAGLLAYLYLLKSMWFLGKRSLLFKASFLGIIIHSFFNNTLFYPWVMEWLWIALAILSERSESKDLV